MKIKHILSAMLLSALPLWDAVAQWNTTKTPFTIVDCEGKNEYYAVTPHFARTTDGKTWMAYKVWTSEGVSTYVQLLDQDGKLVFDGPLGIRLNSYPTNTWWSEYGLDIASDGSALVTVADARNTEPIEGLYYAFVPTIYKISQSGEFLWGADGISFPDYISGSLTNVYVNGDDVYFQFNCTSADERGTYTCRIDPNGTVAVGPKSLAGQMIASEGSDMLAFSSSGEGSTVQRYNRDLEPVWDAPIVYDTLSYSGHDLRPYKIVSDGEGGAAVAFVCAMGSDGHNIRAQYVTADGDLGFGLVGKYLYNYMEYDHNYCGIALNPTTKEILVDWQDKLDRYTVSVGKLNYGGDYLWGETGIQIDEKASTEVLQFSRVGYGSLSCGDWMVAYSNMLEWEKSALIVKRLSASGSVMWEKAVGRSFGINDPTMIVEEDYTYIFWRDDVKNALYGLRIVNEDGTYTAIDGTPIDTSNSSQGEAIYSIGGQRLSTPQKGLNIIRQANGEIIKKSIH